MHARGTHPGNPQVDLAHRGDPALGPKLQSLVLRLGEALVAGGQLEEAEVALRDALGLSNLGPAERLGLLALLADVQLREDSAETEAKVQQRLQQRLAEAGGDASKVRAQH